jgi:hypothetical protein
MHNRCRNPNARRYHRYGGRGIDVCAEWADFAQFYADMGPRPTPKHTLERIDNNAGYSKSNCKWATKSEQNRNKCDNRLVTYNGTTMTLMDASKLAGISFGGLKWRLNAGWNIDRAMTTPPKKLAVHEIMRKRKEGGH